MKPLYFYVFLAVCIGYALYFGDVEKEKQPGLSICSKDLFSNVGSYNSKYPSVYSKLLMGCRLKKPKPDDKKALDLFYRTGTGHLLSIAGLHLGGISLVVYCLLNFIFYCWSWRKKRTYLPFCKVSLALSVVLVVLYVVFIGVELPRARAILMILLSAASFVFVILRNKFVVLALAASIVLVVAPQSIYSYSFYYSFMCVLGIFLSPSKKNINICIIIFVFILPLNLHSSGLLDISSVLSNFITIPFFVFLYFPLQLLFFGVFALGYHSIVVLMEYITVPLLKLLYICDLFGQYIRFKILPLTTVEVFVLYALLFVSMLVLFYRRKLNRGRVIFIYLFALVTTLFYSTYFYFKYVNFDNTVTVFNISRPKNFNGSGDLVLVRSGKFNILIDTGYGDYSVKKAVSDIQRLKISVVDYLILSHSDVDHLGGLPYILAQSGLNIRKVLVSPCMYLNKKELPLTQNVYEVCDNSEIILDGEDKIKFMSPTCAERKKCSNAGALVFSIRTAGHDILFTSDTPAKKLESILHKKELFNFTNTLVQFPHHCSLREYPHGLFKYSKPLLGFCTRDLSLLKSGVDPSEYEFPVFMTGRCGSLDIRLRKNKIKISSQRCSKVYNFI